MKNRFEIRGHEFDHGLNLPDPEVEVCLKGGDRKPLTGADKFFAVMGALVDPEGETGEKDMDDLIGRLAKAPGVTTTRICVSRVLSQLE